MAENRETAAMLAAPTLAVQIDKETTRPNNLFRGPDEIRAELLEQYALCYDEIMALHKSQKLGIPLAQGAARRKS